MVSALNTALMASPRPTTIRLLDATDVGWDQVHVFGPYTSQADIDQAVGFHWTAPESEVIQTSDTANLLVFMNGAAVAMAVLVPRDIADIDTSAGSFTLDADKAVFEVHGDQIPLLVPTS